MLESALVFKAIATVIPPDLIAQTIGSTDSFEERKRKLPSQLVVCLGKAIRLWSSDSIAFSPQKSGQWLESAVDHPGKVLASAKQCLDYDRPAASWVSGDESIICANSGSFGHP